ncbi:MAG: hypothetical protein AAFQ36_13905 [Pseudomonadota bacterium]
MRQRVDQKETTPPKSKGEVCAHEVRQMILENGGSLCPSLEMALVRMERGS